MGCGLLGLQSRNVLEKLLSPSSDSVRPVPMKQCISAFNSVYHTLPSQLLLLSNIPVPSMLHQNFKRSVLCARYFQLSILLILTATLKREHFYLHFTAVEIEAQSC